ncbi:hypothetical protein ABIF97_006986 [Bradyrhizobium japonicum]
MTPKTWVELQKLSRNVSGLPAPTDAVRLVQKILAIPRRGFSVLVDRDHDGLDVSTAPPFPCGLAASFIQGFEEWRQVRLVAEVPHRFRPPSTRRALQPGSSFFSSSRWAHRSWIFASIRDRRDSAEAVPIPLKDLLSLSPDLHAHALDFAPDEVDVRHVPPRDLDGAYREQHMVESPAARA